MISFLDENSDRYNAITEINVKHGVNGEKSLSGRIITNTAVINGIDKGWRLEFQGEFYVVTFAVPVDYGATVEVEFDAVHEFFYDFGHNAVYGLLSGSNTFKAYLDFIFAGSGYSYQLTTAAYAFAKENFGDNLRLELFNDVIQSAGVEFSVNGRVVRIVETVGSDLTTKVQKHFNLNELRLEKNINDFITYKKGFGAWVDEEDHSLGRLEVAYESPLAQRFGRLHGKPVKDERYTVGANLIERLQTEVENSYRISVQISMEDLTQSGYQYEQPRSGDWIMAINDDLGFRQQVRIVSYESQFDSLGQLIQHSITCNSLGAIDRLEKDSAGIQTQIKDIQEQVEKSEGLILQMIVNAGGTARLFFGNIDPETQYELRNGDTWFDTRAEYTVVRHWNGYEWTISINVNQLNDRLQEAEEAVAETSGDLGEVIADINQALVGSGELSLADLFARKISEGDFETLFFQNSNTLGLTFIEDGVTKSIIALHEGVPYIMGQHIILDGDTTVDGDFVVTGDMIADGAIVNHLKAVGIDAEDITVTNLNMENMAGGAIELTKGFRITRDGESVLDIDAETGEVIMNVNSLLINEYSPSEDGVRKDELESYLRYNNGTVEIGEPDAEVKTQFSNDEWAMLRNDVKQMWLEEDTINIMKAHFFERLQVGNFGFVPRENGSLDLRKVVE